VLCLYGAHGAGNLIPVHILGTLEGPALGLDRLQVTRHVAIRAARDSLGGRVQARVLGLVAETVLTHQIARVLGAPSILGAVDATRDHEDCTTGRLIADGARDTEKVETLAVVVGEGKGLVVLAVSEEIVHDSVEVACPGLVAWHDVGPLGRLGDAEAVSPVTGLTVVTSKSKALIEKRCSVRASRSTPTNIVYTSARRLNQVEYSR